MVRVQSQDRESSPLLGSSSPDISARIVPKAIRSRKAIAALLGAAAVVCIAFLAFNNSTSEMTALVGDKMQIGYDRWAVNQYGRQVFDDRSSENGVWNQEVDGPPYVKHVTLYSGPGIDRDGSAENMRKFMHFHKAFRSTHWDTNRFLTSFESEKMRFLYRTHDSVLIVPPLVKPVLTSERGAMLMQEFLTVRRNALVVLGGWQSVYFINDNVPRVDDSSFGLEPRWTEGPYERQKETKGTLWDQGPVTLPALGQQVIGVDVDTLPSNAINLYSGPGVSVAFVLPIKNGMIIYLGYDWAGPFNTLSPAWAQVLHLATQYITQWQKGMPTLRHPNPKHPANLPKVVPFNSMPPKSTDVKGKTKSAAQKAPAPAPKPVKVVNAKKKSSTVALKSDLHNLLNELQEVVKNNDLQGQSHEVLHVVHTADQQAASLLSSKEENHAAMEQLVDQVEHAIAEIETSDQSQGSNPTKSH